MDLSPRHSLAYLAPQQAQKHVTVNEGLRRLDALVQLRAKSRSLAVEPPAPGEGDAYIVPAGAGGSAWGGFQPGAIAAFQDGAWTEIAPKEGYFAYIADEDAFARFAAGAWSAFSGGAAEAAPQFGVNTTADATNRLAVKSDAAYFGHDDQTPGSGDHRLKINKSAAAKTASLLFQSAASGRAEIGLTGDDNLHVKVSADGAAWKEPVTIDRSTGEVFFNALGPASITVKTTSDTNNAVINYLDASPGQARIGAFNYMNDTGGVVGQIAYFFNKATPANEYLRVVVNGAERMKWTADGSVVVGAPTGGAKGDGTINAKAVYDDNTLLSCYVFDAALDGAINLEKWDAKVPDEVIPAKFDFVTGLALSEATSRRRQHAPLRKFAARSGTKYDPLTLDGYARHWREKRHLTSMPNEATFDPERGMAAGEWIQRIVETVEIQAVLIEELNQRLKMLEIR